MRFDEISNDRIVMYYSMFLDNIDEYSTDEVKTFIKCLIVELRKIYNLSLHGYYHLDVYINKIMILEFNLIDEYDDEIDLNIKIHLKSPIMVKFNDYFLTDGDKYYYNNDYYQDISNLDVNKIIEFCDFFYKDEVNKIKNKGILIKNA